MLYGKLIPRQTQCSTTYTIDVRVRALRVGRSSVGTMSKKCERRVALQLVGIRSEPRGGSMHSCTGEYVRRMYRCIVNDQHTDMASKRATFEGPHERWMLDGRRTELCIPDFIALVLQSNIPHPTSFR